MIIEDLLQAFAWALLSKILIPGASLFAILEASGSFVLYNEVLAFTQTIAVFV